MNYRHAFHAGNFADVLKHTVLMLCLDYLKRKDGAFRVVDTHAGAGHYRLDNEEAQRTGEWRNGIGRLLDPAEPIADTAAAETLALYLTAVRAANPAGDLTNYPGSPLLVRHALRAGDTFVANELHPEEAGRLRDALGPDKQCKVSSIDGYAALKAALPPKERRGLVLVDPPFEEPGELVRMTEALAEGLRRFATGIYLLWYPIKDEKVVARFHRGVREASEKAGVRTPLKVELLLRPPRNPLLLNGAGLVIVNQPFTLETQMAAALPTLAARLGEAGKGAFRLGELTQSSFVQTPSDSWKSHPLRPAKPRPR